MGTIKVQCIQFTSYLSLTDSLKVCIEKRKIGWKYRAGAGRSKFAIKNYS